MKTHKQMILYQIHDPSGDIPQMAIDLFANNNDKTIELAKTWRQPIPECFRDIHNSVVWNEYGDMFVIWGSWEGAFRVGDFSPKSYADIYAGKVSRIQNQFTQLLDWLLISSEPFRLIQSPLCSSCLQGRQIVLESKRPRQVFTIIWTTFFNLDRFRVRKYGLKNRTE